ncbi:MAG: NAD-dependent epimerase/dehydratase family protein [Planctomycetaceae bacterium]|nr:NAD-dependent epimerase/dehydratase family protein [Planctomycetaceae bacterium]
MARILVTGGAGFIGSRVVHQLVAMGHEVSIYDAFKRYSVPHNLQYKDPHYLRLGSIADRIRIEFGDTRDVSRMRRVILDVRPQRVLHLAALPIADASNEHTGEAITSIFTGTVNLMEILRELPELERFVYVSSSMVYGDFVQEPALETDPQCPRDVYGGTKYAGEILTQTYGRRYDLPFAIVRPSAVYGPYDTNRRVVQIFVENAMQGHPITLHQGGSARLDFTYVDDTAHGMVQTLLHPAAAGECFNITYGHGYSLKELADNLREYFPDLDVRSNNEGMTRRPRRGALSIEKAKRLIDYKPRYSLEDGLYEVVRSYQLAGMLPDPSLNAPRESTLFA